MANKERNWEGPDDQSSSTEDRELIRGRADDMEDAPSDSEEFEDTEDLDDEEEEGEGSF
jgi:hypothetical protein